MIVPGAQKCGTSSLFAWMTQHPLIHGSSPKEVHFFDGGRTEGLDTWRKGVAWYRAHFPTRSTVGDGLAVEASPLYLFHPDAPARMAELLPSVRLIVLLRDPVDRAISHYHHERRRGRERLSLGEALAREHERLGVRPGPGSDPDGRTGASEGPGPERPGWGPAWIHHSYVRRGLYADQLVRLWRHVPRSRTLVLESRDLFERPEATLREVFTFCGVDAGFMPADLAPRMVGRSREADEGSIAFLQAAFAEPNERLYELLGRRFDW